MADQVKHRFYVRYQPDCLEELRISAPAVHEIWAVNHSVAEHIFEEAEEACSRLSVPWPHLVLDKVSVDLGRNRAADAVGVARVRSGGLPHGWAKEEYRGNFSTGLSITPAPYVNPMAPSLVWSRWADHIRNACEIIDGCAECWGDLQRHCEAQGADSSDWGGDGGDDDPKRLRDGSPGKASCYASVGPGYPDQLDGLPEHERIYLPTGFFSEATNGNGEEKRRLHSNKLGDARKIKKLTNWGKLPSGKYEHNLAEVVQEYRWSADRLIAAARKLGYLWPEQESE